MANGMHTSEVLNNEIFGKQPLVYKLQQDVDAILARFSPERKCGPKVQETLDRIATLSEIIASATGETRVELVSLYAETVTKTHLANYSKQVDILESHQRGRVANILGVTNDDRFSQAA